MCDKRNDEEQVADNIPSPSSTMNDEQLASTSAYPNASNSVPKYSEMCNKSDIDVEAIRQQIKHDKIEGKKPKTLTKLHRAPDIKGAVDEKGVVGDDLNKKCEQNIVCECEPNVTGAAVPAVGSFCLSVPGNFNNLYLFEDSASTNITNEDSDRIFDSSHKCKDNISKCKTKSYSKLKETEREKVNKTPEPTALSRQDNNTESRTLRKPSLIPKLFRPNSSNQRLREHGNIDLLTKQEKHHHREERNKSATKLDKDSLDSIGQSEMSTLNKDSVPGLEIPNKSSSKMVQEGPKVTNSVNRRKIENNDEIISHVVDAPANRDILNNLAELYKSIHQIKSTALVISNNSTIKKQKDHVEKILANITEIKKIADQLSELENITDEDTTKTDHETKAKDKVRKESPTKPKKTKDNKIYIKFMQPKAKQNESRKKNKDSSLNQSDEVQIENALSSKKTSDSLNSDYNTDNDKPKQVDKVKDTDSMDGVFIPSCEPPINIEEEEEESNGLDITITFPEFHKLLTNQTESHLSVRLSDISAEALRKLKRCPKDFTLRMDFIQGKVLFQSGKAPVNNFSIGPDLKFVENVIDDKKSDIISIKPSTECSFASQLISVENLKEGSSYKSLKSTDSELFNVVNLPFIYRNSSLNNTSTKSCITFKNDKILSMAILARQFFKSMPQIPSLTNIFEDKLVENFNRTAFQVQDKRRKNRLNQKRGITSNNL